MERDTFTKTSRDQSEQAVQTCPVANLQISKQHEFMSMGRWSLLAWDMMLVLDTASESALI